MPYWKSKHNLVICLVLALIVSWGNAVAGKDPLSNILPKVLPLDEAFNFKLTHEEKALQAKWEIAPLCYIYQKSLTINAVSSEGESYPLLQGQLPEAANIDDPYFGRQAIYRHSLNIELPLSTQLLSQDKATYTIQVEFQGCSESGFCYPPTTKNFELQIKEHKIISIFPTMESPHNQKQKPPVNANENEPAPAVADLTDSGEKRGFFASVATFYVIGLLLTFTPCVLPMIPILAGVIVGQKHLNTRKAFWLSLSYVLSMAFTYALAGVVVATLGKNLQASLQHPGVLISFSLLFAFLAVVQLGWIRLTLPHHLRLKDILHTLHAKQESGTYIGAAMMGVLATLVSSPCVTAPLIGALGYISHSGDIVLGASALLAMGLGMGTFLLAMGTLGGKFLPKSGPWMHHVNQAFAIIMFGLSLFLFDRVFHGPWVLILWGGLCLFIAWCMNTFKSKTGWSGRIGMIFVFYAALLFWGATKGEQDPLKVLTFNPWSNGEHKTASLVFEPSNTPSAFKASQTQAKQQARPLMLVFYANWCISCKHLERKVFDSHSVQEQLKDWQLVRADITDYNEASQQFLKKFDLIGPPAVLFFAKDGRELTKYRIVGEVSEKEFLAQLERMKTDLDAK